MTKAVIEQTKPAEETTPGSQARKLRIANYITRRELADLAGVSTEHIELLEHDLPLPLDSRRRIFRVLWARRVGK